MYIYVYIYTYTYSGTYVYFCVIKVTMYGWNCKKERKRINKIKNMEGKMEGQPTVVMQEELHSFLLLTD